MNEDVTIKGLWWLPSKPEKELSGEITYGLTTGARLSLLDHFFDVAKRDRFTVWGMTAKGKPITLFDCYTRNLTVHIFGARVAEVSSYFWVVGGHFNTPEEMKFAKVTAELSHLHEWAWTTGLSGAQTADKQWQVIQKMLPDISLGSHSDFAIALAFIGRISPGYGSWNLSEDCFFTIATQNLTPYEAFEDVIHQFQHFVALGVAQPVYVLSVTARIDKPEHVIHGQSIYEEFEIFRKLSFGGDSKGSLTPHDMQFCLGDLTPNASACLELYFEKYQLLKPVYDLYFSTLYNPDMYVNQRFLALGHAIEAYHRAFVGGKYQSNDKYRNGLLKALWNAIPQNIDADFRASLKNKLKYLHEFSLRKRIQDICGKFSTVIKPFLGESGQFAAAVADQRNMLTHPDSTAEEQPSETDWSNVWLMSEQLSLLLEVCLLHEIGFADESIAKLLIKNRRAMAIQLNRK